MGDIWSGIGNDIKSDEGEWLYKVGTEMRGPMPHRQVVDKLIKGDIDFSTLVAREGTEFHPIRAVAAFLPHLEAAQKARAKRESNKRNKQVALALIPVLLLAVGGVVYLQSTHKASLAKQAKERAAIEAKYAAQQAAQAQADPGLPKMGLVALVSLGTMQDVKISGQHAAGESHAKHKAAGGGGGKQRHVEQGPDGPDEPEAAADEEVVQTCTLTQNDIFGTLRAQLGKLNLCVDDEKKRDTEGLLPPSLELQFIVKPNGKVTEFAINDRHYRAGPLNNCLTRAFGSISFPESNGANCPVSIPIKIGK